MKLSAKELGSALAAVVVALVAVFQFAEARYVAASDFDSLSVEIYYEQYYKAVDLLEKAKAEHKSTAEVNDHRRRAERLRVKICKIDTEWSKCKDAA